MCKFFNSRPHEKSVRTKTAQFYENLSELLQKCFEELQSSLELARNGTSSSSSLPQPLNGTSSSSSLPQPRNGTSSSSSLPQPRNGMSSSSSLPQPRNGTSSSSSLPQPPVKLVYSAPFTWDAPEIMSPIRRLSPQSKKRVKKAEVKDAHITQNIIFIAAPALKVKKKWASFCMAVTRSRTFP